MLDVLGDRWTLLIVRDMLFFNKHEFKEFLENPEKIATNILTDRLKKLQDHGVIKSAPHPDSKKRKFYYLTDSGKALAQPLMHLIIWAHEYLDTVNLPEDIAKELVTDSKGIIKRALATLDEWEKQNLKKA